VKTHYKIEKKLKLEVYQIQNNNLITMPKVISKCDLKKKPITIETSIRNFETSQPL
jgi:hypothetical protein